jgi:hypothetical protein
MNLKRYMMLSMELKVALEIHKLNKWNQVPYFSLILKEINKINDVTSSQLHTSIDHLIDLGSIDAEWKKTEDHIWVREFYLKNPMRDFINKIYDEIEYEVK